MQINDIPPVAIGIAASLQNLLLFSIKDLRSFDHLEWPQFLYAFTFFVSLLINLRDVCGCDLVLWKKKIGVSYPPLSLVQMNDHLDLCVFFIQDKTSVAFWY